MNKKLKSIATTVAAVGIGWSGLAQAATVHRTTSTRTVVVEKPKSAGQIAGEVVTSPFWLAGNILMLPVRAVEGSDLWPSPPPVAERTVETQEVVTYHHKTTHKHHRKHQTEPVGERTTTKYRVYPSGKAYQEQTRSRMIHSGSSKSGSGSNQ